MYTSYLSFLCCFTNYVPFESRQFRILWNQPMSNCVYSSTETSDISSHVFQLRPRSCWRTAHLFPRFCVVMVGKVKEPHYARTGPKRRVDSNYILKEVGRYFERIAACQGTLPWWRIMVLRRRHFQGSLATKFRAPLRMNGTAIF